MEADGTVSEVKVAHTGDPEVIEVSINWLDILLNIQEKVNEIILNWYI